MQMTGHDDVIQFIRELHDTEDFIPLHAPSLDDYDKKYVNEAIDSTFVSSVGQFVDRFEKEFAAYIGSEYAIAVVNGTAALHISLKLAGVQQNDEVITQPLTFVATCNAISYCGAESVFVDVDPVNLGLSPDSLKSFLELNTFQQGNMCINKTTGKIIRACVPMHTFGHPVRIEEILEICNEFNIALVEDAAESLGSSRKSQHTGNFGILSAFSFNGNKVMTTGGGGMIVTNDEELATRAKHLTTTAKLPHRWEFNHDQIGFNYRMPNLNAALGCSQLEKLPELLRKKKSLADKYREYFIDTCNHKFIDQEKSSQANFWLNAILLNSREERDNFLEKANNCKVMSRPCWTLMSMLPMFKQNQRADELINAQLISQKLVNIPSSPI